jgi:hypothetical protein
MKSMKKNTSKNDFDISILNYINQIERILVNHYERDYVIARVCFSSVIALLREMQVTMNVSSTSKAIDQKLCIDD